MKKTLIAIMTIVLTMLISSTAMSFADTQQTPDMSATKAKQTSATQEKTYKSDAEKAISSKITERPSNLASTGTIPFQSINTGGEKVAVADVQYTSSDIVYSGRAGIRRAISVPHSGVIMVAAGNYANSSASINFGVFKDAAMTQPVQYAGYAAQGKSDVRAVKVSKGTYYVGIYSSTYSMSSSVYARITSYFVSGSNRTLSSGRYAAVGNYDESTKYFKFKAKYSGSISVAGSNLSGQIYLLNSKKKALSSKVYINSTASYSYMKSAVFGVKKGSTYYLKVHAYGNYSKGYYRIKYSNKNVTDKSGSKKSKAKKISAKKTYSGSIIAGSSQADWYKFKLTSRKNISIRIKGATNDCFKITVCKSNGTRITGGSGYFYRSSSSLTLKSLSKFSRGTYYIKVQRGNSKSSGNYSVYWKTR